MNILFRRLKQAQGLKNLAQQSRSQALFRPTYSSKVLPNRTWVGFLFGLASLNEIRRSTARTAYAEESKEQQEQHQHEVEEGFPIEREEKISMLGKITSYEIGESKDYREGVLKEIKVMHEGKEVSVLITRVEGKLYATSAFCTYDDKTHLSDGIIFNNKVYAPIHGSAYNIQTGTVEYGPAVDNLAIYFIKEKEGKVLLGLPKYPPKKVKPFTIYRDYNDLRKVVIVGSGIAAMVAIETLRQNGFTGEIKMISKDTLFPYDKTRLTKTFKPLRHEDLAIRPAEYFDDYGIEYLFGREVKEVKNVHGGPHIELEDGLKIEYDALLVASGADPENREIEGLRAQSNVSYLRDLHDHERIRLQLENKIKDVVIIGANLTSLEAAAAIRTDFPGVNVHVVDENENLYIDDKLTREVADAVLDLHKKNGVKFTFAKVIEKFVGDDDTIKEIVLEDESKINADLFLLFPNNVIANTEYLFEGENCDNLEFDEENRLKVDFNHRANHKRIFGAGHASAGYYHAQTTRLPCTSYYQAYHGGMVAAYNILALEIPSAVVPFTNFKHYNKTFNYSGYSSYFNETHIDGDLKSLDFIVYYSLMGTILAAFGSDTRKRDMLVVNEAFRLNIMPPLSDLQTGKETIATIEKRIRDSKRSGCFKDLIQEIKYQPNPEEVVWMQREKSNEFHNFWDEGKTHMGANVMSPDNEGK